MICSRTPTESKWLSKTLHFIYAYFHGQYQNESSFLSQIVRSCSWLIAQILSIHTYVPSNSCTSFKQSFIARTENPSSDKWPQKSSQEGRGRHALMAHNCRTYLAWFPTFCCEAWIVSFHNVVINKQYLVLVGQAKHSGFQMATGNFLFTFSSSAASGASVPSTALF